MLKKFIDFGFKETEVRTWDNCERVAYYWIRDNGRKLQIRLRYFKYAEHEGMEADTQLNQKGKTFNVHLLSAHKYSPRELVEWFDNLFNVMECDYYE